MSNPIDDLCLSGEYNGDCTLTTFTLNASTTWAVRTSITPIVRTTTWDVFYTLRITRQTFWGVKDTCRGARTFLPFDLNRIPQTYAEQGALVASVTVCLLSPSTRTTLQAPTHTGQHAIIAQTKYLYLDDQGNVYIKSSNTLLGELQLLSPIQSGAFANDVIQLRIILASQS